jgi:hypothetical protein
MVYENPMPVFDGVWFHAPVGDVNVDRVFYQRMPTRSLRFEHVNRKYKLLDVVFSEAYFGEDLDTESIVNETTNTETTISFSGTIEPAIDTEVAEEPVLVDRIKIVPNKDNADLVNKMFAGYCMQPVSETYRDRNYTGFLIDSEGIYYDATLDGWYINVPEGFSSDVFALGDPVTQVTKIALFKTDAFVMVKHKVEFRELETIDEEFTFGDDQEVLIIPAWLRWKCEQQSSIISQETIAWANEAKLLIRRCQASSTGRANMDVKGRNIAGLSTRLPK